MKEVKNKILLCFVVCVFALVGCGNQKSESTKVQLFAMDTVMDLTVYGDKGDEAIEKASQLIKKYEGLFSVNIATSDISRINQSTDKFVTVAPETYQLVQDSMQMSKETQGLFDISVFPIVKLWGFTTGNYKVPTSNQIKETLKNVDYKRIICGPNNQIKIGTGMAIDLGAIAKGYTSMKIKELWKKMGVESAIVSLGGNVEMIGSKPDQSTFNVGITNPFHPDTQMGILKISDKSVITSGNYERYFEKNGVRYHHIMDPRIGSPAQNDLVSITVVTDKGERGDELSTSLFVMGSEKAMAMQRKLKDFEIICVKKDGTISMSSGISEKFTISDKNLLT